MKRGAAAKDVIPDESFLRLRGALFFGPGFLVTRNKLTFRDNLQELLRTAVPSRAATYLLPSVTTAFLCVSVILTQIASNSAEGCPCFTMLCRGT